ncbi:MAG: hypothetical protein M3128_13160 [Verrucomicrobiota bacterium]|nr:hypothetical protein [Verrucomicrobiota bacterium]
MISSYQVRRTLRSNRYDFFVFFFAGAALDFGFPACGKALIASIAPERRFPLAMRRSVRALPAVNPGLPVTEFRALSFDADFNFAMVFLLSHSSTLNSHRRKSHLGPVVFEHSLPVMPYCLRCECIAGIDPFVRRRLAVFGWASHRIVAPTSASDLNLSTGKRSLAKEADTFVIEGTPGAEWIGSTQGRQFFVGIQVAFPAHESVPEATSVKSAAQSGRARERA